MHTRLLSPTCLYQKSMHIYLGNNQQNQVHKFIMVLFTKQSLKNFDNGCDITDLLHVFLHHISKSRESHEIILNSIFAM